MSNLIDRIGNSSRPIIGFGLLLFMNIHEAASKNKSKPKYIAIINSSDNKDVFYSSLDSVEGESFFVDCNTINMTNLQEENFVRYKNVKYIKTKIKSNNCEEVLYASPKEIARQRLNKIVY